MDAAKAHEAGLTRAVTRVARLRRQHRVRMCALRRERHSHASPAVVVVGGWLTWWGAHRVMRAGCGTGAGRRIADIILRHAAHAA